MIKMLTSLCFLFWCCSSFVAFAIEEEANSLLKWKSSLPIQGQSSLSSWNTTKSNSSSEPCNWAGISCNNGSVASMELKFFGLKGTLEEFPFSSLPNLTQIDFSYNELFGILPSRISNLSKLVNIDMSRNSLHGTIPPEIGLLQHLELLRLDRNNFSGPIPESIGNLKRLTTIFLSYNKFSGPIPSELGNMTSLNVLYLANNYFNGSIPESIGSLRNLVLLYLPQNQLSGPIPGSIANLVNLTHLSLRLNNLSGNLEMHMFSGLKNLQLLDLSENKLQGPIPSSIANLVNLQILYLQSNNLSIIVESDLFSNLQNLRDLDLSYNNVLWKIGFTLPRLRKLGLAFCDLNQFPEFIRESSYLETLDLSNNKIEGPIPKWMRDTGKNTMGLLNLSNNSLTGGLEPLAWENIRVLDIRSNKFQGVLPTPPAGMVFFSASNNNFTGDIPSGICNAIELAILDLSRNNFRGNIPNCIFNLSRSLSVLNLRANNFQGTIPSEFPEGCRLQNLDLHANQLQGPLPRSLVNCSMLEVLDIGFNNINDTFPTWLESLNEVQVLVLRSNKFHDSIRSRTETNSSFPKLRILDISDNDFSGSLPIRYIENLKAMADTPENVTSPTYMQQKYFQYHFSVVVTLKGQDMHMEKIFTMFTSIDFSKNKFSGKIPDAIGRLHSLKGLYLSHNNLGGHIPQSLGELTNMEALDLSSNELVGKIPEELASTTMTQLSFLNLSYNQLDGRVPQGTQFATFGNDSYQGNIGLCGPPVSKNCSESGTNEQPPSSSQEKDEFWEFISWRVVGLGYGCGTIFGLLMGYLMFKTGKPKWFVSSVDLYSYLRGRKMNRARRRVQRRN